VHEQKAGLDLMLVAAAVDCGGDLVLHKLLLSTTGLAAPGNMAESRRNERSSIVDLAIRWLNPPSPS
jgi:hypothetical protein